MTKKIITKKEVEYVAKLAKLEFSEKEKVEFAAQLNSILSYFNKLNELDTKNISPTAYVILIPNSFNKDTVQISLPQSEVISTNQNIKNGYFQVPKIV